MKEDDLAQNYIAAMNHLLQLIDGTNQAIVRSKRDDDSLSVRQYQHLRADYLNQLADLMNRSPDAIRLELIAH